MKVSSVDSFASFCFCRAWFFILHALSQTRFSSNNISWQALTKLITKMFPSTNPSSLTMIFHQTKRSILFIDRCTEGVILFHLSVFDFSGLSFSLMETEHFSLRGWAETQSSLKNGDCWECFINLPQGFLRCPDD